mmetsp:Transcript_37214/g.75807  ORF Transcript_37214/g.75807 Transcript_37214/m.75807 type:complete len:143 (+) Transcript_37214:133-561(+)
MLSIADPPAKVLQDDFSPAKGNALQACVASLFDEPLSDVPNFIALECGYEQGIQQYLQEKAPNKYKCIKKKGRDEVPKSYFNDLCILRGKSPRGDFGHVVIARLLDAGKDGTAFERIFDPHPDATFLDESEEFGWCMFFREV